VSRTTRLAELRRNRPPPRSRLLEAGFYAKCAMCGRLLDFSCVLEE